LIGKEDEVVNVNAQMSTNTAIM